MKIRHSRPYRQARQEAYPTTGDQLDAIHAAIDVLVEAAQAQGVPVPQKVRDYLDACKRVKATHPKN